MPFPWSSMHATSPGNRHLESESQHASSEYTWPRLLLLNETARGTTEQEERRETEEPEARKERRGEEDGVEAGRVSEDVHVGSGGQGASAAQQIESLMSGPEGCGLFVSARTSHPDACEVADESDSEMEDA